MTDGMRTKAIVGAFGSNRTLARTVGAQLGKLKWCGVPFCGGGPELPFIQCRTGVASDAHLHIVNLCNVVRSPAKLAALVALLDGRLHHEAELRNAQAVCAAIEIAANVSAASRAVAGDVEWAAAYYAACWMTRGGQAASDNEFTGGLSYRLDGDGGDSAVRWRGAVESLPAWGRALARWSFPVLRAAEFLCKVPDRDGCGLYCDPPWPNGGEEYRHKFNDADHEELARRLALFTKTRVVVRYGDHPLIRSLYPAPRWRWIEQSGRNAGNKTLSEVLIINGDPYPVDNGEPENE